MDDTNQTYTFSFNDSDCATPDFPVSRHYRHEVTFDSGIQWTKVADEFFNFLSSVYGYQIDLSKHYGKK